MKYLLVLAVIAVAIWFWRRSRPPVERTRGPKRPPAVGAPEAMVRCAQCGLHLPAVDAVPGKRGVYCGAAHLQLAEPRT